MEQITGKFFEVNQNNLYFGTKGNLLVSAVNVPGAEMILEPEPFTGFPVPIDTEFYTEGKPISARINDVIEKDSLAGKKDLIAYVGVTPLTACLLWTEGVITLEHFNDIEETDSYIKIYDVVLGGQPRMVVIMIMDEYDYATFDKEGNVV